MTLVSVVIPTRNRPEFVLRAVNSAIAQTLSDIEIIVVVDGDDGKTAPALEAVADPRLRVLILPENRGASEARNFGVSKATAPWIALLDDDDEMLPERLAVQHRAAEKSRAKYPVVVCRLYVQTGRGKYIQPKRLPRDGEDVSEYMLNKTSIIGHVGTIASSTMLVKKELMSDIGFPKLKRHQDWTWVLKANAVDGCLFEFVPEPLCIYHAEHHVTGSGASISSRNDWEWSVSWANDYRELMTGKAYASYLLTTTAGMAKRQSDWRAISTLVRNAFANGNPTLTHCVMFLGIWLLPGKAQPLIQDLRYRLRPLAWWRRGSENRV
jgi:glycosyltransferase involved in cell wall biosynthesis